jgi:pyruvate formate lyase activating enzyme
MDPQLHRQYTGVDNGQILENLGRLLSAGARVWVRWPVIPGVNDDPVQLLALRAFYDRYGWPERTQLLPFHAMGENKYPALGRTYTPFAVPDAKVLKELEKLLL